MSNIVPRGKADGVMNEFASLIHPQGYVARYSTYISSSLGRRVKF